MQLRGEGEGEGEGEGKKETCTSKCGIIARMKNTRNAAVDASAVISGGSVACADAAQNAAVRASLYPPPLLSAKPRNAA